MKKITLVVLLVFLCSGQFFTCAQSHLLGDVNSDNIVIILDALLIAQYYVNLDPGNFDPVYADVNTSETSILLMHCWLHSTM